MYLLLDLEKTKVCGVFDWFGVANSFNVGCFNTRNG